MPDPHRPGARSQEHRTIAVALNEMTKLVFSRTLEAVTWRNARLVRELQPGDEYQLGVCPVFLPSGDLLVRYTRSPGAR